MIELPDTARGLESMTTTAETLQQVARIIRIELPRYLSTGFTIHEIKAERRPGPDDEDYIHVMVIFEDGHPKLDVRATLQFSHAMRPLFEQIGIPLPPNISYADWSELNK